LYEEMGRMQREAEEAQRRYMAEIEAREAEHRRQLERSATAVQARRRGQLGRRAAQVKRDGKATLYALRRHAAAARIQAAFRTRRLQLYILGMHCAACLIQRVHRGNRSRRSSGSHATWRSAALAIQAGWRGWLGRRRAAGWREHRAALRLQSLLRTLEPKVRVPAWFLVPAGRGVGVCVCVCVRACVCVCVCVCASRATMYDKRVMPAGGEAAATAERGRGADPGAGTWSAGQAGGTAALAGAARRSAAGVLARLQLPAAAGEGL
jgi:hypothetical protein